MKKLSLIVLMLAMVQMLTACGAFTCEMCGEEKTGAQYEATIANETMVICTDCKEEIEEIQNYFK